MLGGILDVAIERWQAAPSRRLVPSPMALLSRQSPLAGPEAASGAP